MLVFKCTSCGEDFAKLPNDIQHGDYIWDKIEPSQGHNDGDLLHCKKCGEEILHYELTNPTNWDLESSETTDE